jgi:hypothetical protein
MVNRCPRCRHLVIWAASHWPVAVEKRSLIVRKARDQALVILGNRHGFEEWQETVSTFIMNFAGAPAEESARFANMSRPEIVVKEKWSRQLEEFPATGMEV